MTTHFVHIPKIEDEIEDAWQGYCQATADTSPGPRAIFEAGFRCARTFEPISQPPAP